VRQVVDSRELLAALNRTRARRPHLVIDCCLPTLDPLKFAEGSALIDMGDTKVLVAATLESRVPPFLIDSGRGWVTGEYAMLPRATSTRSRRGVGAWGSTTRKSTFTWRPRTRST